MNSIGAAFQHAGVYIKGLKNMAPRKSDCRNDLKNTLIAIGNAHQSSVSALDQCQNIVNCANESTANHQKKGILRDDRFRIEITQKALNIYLKYLWCLGEINKPPHCPIDRGIIDVLGIPWNQHNSYGWTTLDDIEKYMELIEMCKMQAVGIMSVAEWDLDKWKP